MGGLGEQLIGRGSTVVARRGQPGARKRQASRHGGPTPDLGRGHRSRNLCRKRARPAAVLGRDPEELVRQTCGPAHQYPDGFALYLGTMFAPTDDRGEPGKGFTHKTGDRVRVASDPLGALVKNLPILVLIMVHGAIADRR